MICLNYLKYSHLEPIKENNILKVDRATQYPDIRNNFTQTKPIQISDKETDTYNDLNKMDRNARYILKGYDKGFNNDKQPQVNSHLIREYEPKTPPSSGDEGGESFFGSSVKTGFRLAEFALTTSIMGANLTIAVGDAIADLITAPHQTSDEDKEQQNNTEVITVNSSPPETINSSSSPDVTQISSSSSSRQAPSSLPAPTSPQPSSPASSAKTTPRRK